MNKKNYLYSSLSLVLSLNIILNGVTHFSRSGFLVYFMMYAMYVPFYYNKFTNKTKRTMKLIALSIFCLTLFVFYIITINRFTGTLQYEEGVYSQSYINDPVLLSLFDYFSQWYKNCNEVMSVYTFKTLNGDLSSPLLMLLADKLHLVDYPPGQIELKLYSLWGGYYDKFNGLIANLLFDFGYIGTILFVSGYWMVMRRLRPINGMLSFNHFIILGGLFVFPAMGIFNSELKSVFYNLVILYSIGIYSYLRIENQNPLSRVQKPL